jgi:hypothetical protein
VPAFAEVLDQPGWYADFHSPAESFVVFPGRIFRYPRGEFGRLEDGDGRHPWPTWVRFAG